MGKRILLITQWFDPEPTFKGLLFAKELVARGFEVEVVTGFPNYPGGKIYEGYKVRWTQKEQIEGVDITRVALYPSHDSSAMGRILNYLSFAFTAFVYCLFRVKKADVIYAYHPPLTIGMVACLTRFFRKTPVVYDVQDMWPDTLKATGMINNQRLLNIIGRVAKWVYGRVDHIVVLSPGFKYLLIERGVEPSKITVIPNWCDEEALKGAGELVDINLNLDDRFKIVFAGNMGKAQALDLVVQSAKVLQELQSSVVFLMIGGGLEVERLKNEVEKNGLNNIIFLPRVSINEIGAYLKQADALLVHLKKDELFNITIPSKTQAYLSIGKPVLMGVEGDAADIIRSAEAGVVFEPENVQSLLKAIHSLTSKTHGKLDAMGFNGKNYYMQHLSLKVGVNAFEVIFSEISTS